MSARLFTGLWVTAALMVIGLGAMGFSATADWWNARLRAERFGQRSAFHRCWLVTHDLGQPTTQDFISQGGNACWRQYNEDWLP
jgi:hypothetical protein